MGARGGGGCFLEGMEINDLDQEQILPKLEGSHIGEGEHTQSLILLRQRGAPYGGKWHSKVEVREKKGAYPSQYSAPTRCKKMALCCQYSKTRGDGTLLSILGHEGAGNSGAPLSTKCMSVHLGT